MNEKWIDNEKKEIYFLEWLSKESGFSENQILKNMKPENQGWANNSFIFYSLEEYLNSIECLEDYLSKIFDWGKSFIEPNYYFWDSLYHYWIKTVKKYKDFKIKFSNLEIDYYKFKIKESDKKLKVKNLKI